MKAYVLFHADIEDDRYVRGVYANEGAAQGDVTADEWHDNYVLAEYAMNLNATDPVITPRGEKTINRPYRRQHDEYCCSVEEYEVRGLSTPRHHGPFIDELRNPNARGLFRDSVLEEMVEQWMRPNPIMELVAQMNPLRPIGTVTKITEDDLGITVEGKLHEPREMGDRGG